MTPILCAVLLLIILSAAPGIAEEIAFERVLIPLHIRGVAGAAGTRWSTELVARNEGSQSALILSQVCLHDCTCGGEQCLVIRPTPPGQASPWIGPGPCAFASIPSRPIFVTG